MSLGVIFLINPFCGSQSIITVLFLLRTVKTQTNRVYRDNVLGTQNNSKKNKEISVITRLQYEEVIIS